MIRKTRWLAAVVLVGAMSTQWVSSAQAGDSEADRRRRARSFVEEANSKYDLGKYDDAIRLYEQAYEIWPHPETLFNLCQAHRQKKDLEAAVRYCKAFLRNDPKTDRREQIGRASCRERVWIWVVDGSVK